jgi:hypothetical protein
MEQWGISGVAQTLGPSRSLVSFEAEQLDVNLCSFVVSLRE